MLIICLAGAAASALPRGAQPRSAAGVAAAAAAGGSGRAGLQRLIPGRATILGDARRALDYFTNLTGHAHADCGWEWSTFMVGVTHLQHATGDPALRDWARKFGEKYGWEFCNHNPVNADNQICAATYADLYLTSPPSERNASWIAPTIKHYESEMALPKNVVHWMWVDTLFMAINVWGRLGAITGDARYFDRMAGNFDYAVTSKKGYGLWSERDRLFLRDPPGSSNYPEGVFWSRGNGWAFAALASALEYSRPGDPRRARYAALFEKHAARLAGLQGPSGCWPVSLTHPEFNPTPETTGTAMFAYGMAWGIRSGLLDAARYGPTLARAWRCLATHSLQPSGRVGYCQPGGDRPARNVGPDSTSSFCVGQFLMAASELSKLAAAGGAAGHTR